MKEIKDLFSGAITKKERIQANMFHEKEGYHIAFSCTSNYLVHTGIVMTSILISNPGQVFQFHLFVNGVDPEDKKKLQQLAEKYKCSMILYYIDDAVFAGMLHSDGIAAFFYRFLIPPAVAEDGVSRILYMDGDMMCQGGLSSLMNMQLDGNIAACVEDTSPAYAEMRRRRVGTKAYFNSGMMLIDVSRWNAAQISQRAAAMAIERKKSGARLHSHDQDILNILLDGQFKKVGRQFNYIYNMDMKGFFQRQEPLVYDERAVLVHFAGIVKPWRTWVQDLPGVREYAGFRSASPWRDVPLKGIASHKDLHQAARHARRMRKYGKAFCLYGRYLTEKLTGKR